VGYFPQNNTLALSSAGGSGDTDIVRWSGTGGNVIQDGYTQDAPTITNAGVINAPAASTFGKSGNIVTIAGSETINQNLTVTGTTTHTGGVTLNSTLTANGAITATGAITQTGGGAIALSGTLTQTATTSTFKDIVERRPIATAGTAIVGGTASSGVIAGSDFTYTGWGSAAVFTINKLGSNDTRFDLIITASASGLAANPTFTLTFKDGTFGTAPFAVVMWNHPSSNPGSSLPLRWSSTQTTLTVTYIGTPSSTFNYGFTVFVLG
jgi:hypothetical protein